MPELCDTGRELQGSCAEALNLIEMADRLFCIYNEQDKGSKAEASMPGAQRTLEASREVALEAAVKAGRDWAVASRAMDLQVAKDILDFKSPKY